MNIKIILLFIIISSSTWAQKSFDIKTSYMVTAEGYLIPTEVQFKYNQSSNSLNMIWNDENIHLPLELLFEEYFDNKKFYLYAFSGDPNSPEYRTLPAVSFYFNKKNGKITHIQIEYYDINNNKPAEPLKYVTEFGLNYIKN